MKRDWLSTLLQSKFFGSCVHHQEIRKNEENVFCIDCSLGFCRHCMAAHCFHRRLQICKYVYHDVVRLHEMQKHIDCSKIQVFLYSYQSEEIFFPAIVALKCKMYIICKMYSYNWIFVVVILLIICERALMSFWLFLLLSGVQVIFWSFLLLHWCSFSNY